MRAAKNRSGGAVTDLYAEDLTVHLTPGDAWTTQSAGTTYARTLAGAASEDFALALAEQEGLIRRAIAEAGHTAEQTQLTAERFEIAAAAEWQRIIGAGAGGPGGQA